MHTSDSESDSAPTTMEVSVSLAATDDERAATLVTPKCNDCTICRVLDCIRETPDAPAVPEDGSLPGKPFTSEIMKLNLVGVRRPRSHSNQFDDFMIVFYRPIDHDNGTVLDLEVVGEQVDVDAIEQFLADDDLRSNLNQKKGKKLPLPGIDSQSADGKPCRTHIGWNMLIFELTTEPGFIKATQRNRKKNKFPIQLTAENADGLIFNRAATVMPGTYENAWKLYVHHWGKLGGHPALTQTDSINIRRAARGDYLLWKVKADAAGWSKTWQRSWQAKSWRKKYKKQSDARYKRELVEYENWQQHLVAVDQWTADGEEGPAPVAPAVQRGEEPVREDPKGGAAFEEWLRQYLDGRLASHISLDGFNTENSELLEIREQHLEGTRRDVANLRVDYAYTPKEGKTKAKLTIDGVSADAGGESWAPLAESDIVVARDHDKAGINIHRSNKSRSANAVYDYSEGCQVFRNPKEFDQFRAVCSLSKRATCAKRKSGECPSIASGPLTADDLIYHLYATKNWTASKGPTRLDELNSRGSAESADGFLRRKLEENRDAELLILIDDKCQSLRYAPSKRKRKSKPYHGTWTKSRATGWKDHSDRLQQSDTDIRTVFDENLLPDEERTEVRDKWWKEVGGAIARDIRAAVVHGLNSDSTLATARQTKSDERFDELQAAAEAEPSAARRKRKLSTKSTRARRRTADAEAKKTPEVRAAWAAAEADILLTYLDSLSVDLQRITEDIGPDDIAAMIENIRKKCEKRAPELHAVGLEVCDLFYDCKTRFSYTLTAPKPEAFDAVLERFGKTL